MMHAWEEWMEGRKKREHNHRMQVSKNSDWTETETWEMLEMKSIFMT